jgi:hypothetical protein
MKARHPSARTGGTRSFWQFSASQGPVALRSWGEFGRAAFPSRGHLVRGHHCPRSSVAAGSGKSCPINRWFTQPHPSIARQFNLADLGRHAHALGLRQCPHIPGRPRCGSCAFCSGVYSFTILDASRTSRQHRAGLSAAASISAGAISVLSPSSNIDGRCHYPSRPLSVRR